MRKLNRKTVIVITIFALIVVVLCAKIVYSKYTSYVNYINSQIDINFSDEKAIKNYLSNEESEVDIIAIEEYKDYVGILYKTSLDISDDYGYFIKFEKSKYDNGLYIKKGGSVGNFTMVNCSGTDDDDKNVTYFIYNIPSEETICSVFEIDEKGDVVKKLEEINVTQNGYVIAKEYELENKNNRVQVFDGSIDIDNEWYFG